MRDSPTVTEPLIADAGLDQPASAVLARKYRPENFDSIIGQDTVVTILRRALEQDRVAQAMVFHGIRGTGKTTLARIVAKGLNCQAVSTPTDRPCGACRSCRDIAAGQSLDVQEIDAASHTGVDHIRDLIASVSFTPAGRYKVYILDEVHMLSGSAFNALLKTLEEPPAHVKFLFATTELRKIPATVLSRTQRFTLKRVDSATLLAFLLHVVEQEGKTADEVALQMIVRAGEGSVRDSLSLLDQLLSGVEHLDERRVRDQLGKADTRVAVLMLQALFDQNALVLLALVQQQRDEGYDALAIVEDLLMFCHQLSRYRVIGRDDPELSPAEQEFVQQSAPRLNMSVLARLWQLLLSGVGEIKQAISPMMALEMLMIRALYLADVPTPGQILASASRRVSPPPQTQIQTGPEQPSSSLPGIPSPELSVPPIEITSPSKVEPPPQQPAIAERPAPEFATQAEVTPPPIIHNFQAMIDLLEERNEGHLASLLRVDARLKKFGDHQLSLYIAPQWRDALQSLAPLLQLITNREWTVTLLDSEEGCQDSVQQQAQARQEKLMKAARNDTTMQEIGSLFPGARLVRLSSNPDV